MIPTGRNHACEQYMRRDYNGSVLCAAAYACSNSRPTDRPLKRMTICPPFQGISRLLGSWATCGAPNRPSTEKSGHGEKFSPWSGSHATSRYVASLHGVSYRTVQNAAEFAKAVDALAEIEPKLGTMRPRGY